MKKKIEELSLKMFGTKEYEKVLEVIAESSELYKTFTQEVMKIKKEHANNGNTTKEN